MNKIVNDIRPCFVAWGGDRNRTEPAIFHGWTTIDKKYGSIEKGTLVALIETQQGRMDYTLPRHITFIDTKENLSRIKESRGIFSE